MKSILFSFLIIVFCQTAGYSKDNAVSFEKATKEISVTDNIVIANTVDAAMLLKGNPNSWWNRWGKKSLAFTGTFAACAGAGFGLGSVIPGVGTVSGTIIGSVAGIISGIAVVRKIKRPGE